MTGIAANDVTGEAATGDCLVCGTQVRESARFCGACGAPRASLWWVLLSLVPAVLTGVVVLKIGTFAGRLLTPYVNSFSDDFWGSISNFVLSTTIPYFAYFFGFIGGWTAVACLSRRHLGWAILVGLLVGVVSVLTVAAGLLSSGMAPHLVRLTAIPKFWGISLGMPLLGAFVSALAARWLGDLTRVGHLVARIPGRYWVTGIMSLVVFTFLFFLYWLAVTAIVIAIVVAIVLLVLFIVLKSIGGSSSVSLGDRSILVETVTTRARERILYDEDGRKVGKDVRKGGFLGDEKVVHYDAEGKKTGESVEKEAFLTGEKRIEHRDERGEVVGTDVMKEGFFGKDYVEHRGAEGGKTGETTVERGVFGGVTLETRDADGRVVRERSFEADIEEGLFGDKLVTRTKTTKEGE